MPDDDFGIYKINRTRKTPEISILPPFFKPDEKKKKQKEKEEKRQRDTFKEDFLKRFGLDKERFSVNLIKKDGRWLVEVHNKKTKRKIYQDYNMVCNILDIRCKLPKIIGANIDKKA